MISPNVQGKRSDHPNSDGIDVEAEVVGCYDAVDEVPSYVVADITRDGAWLSVAVTGAIDVRSWS